MSASAQLLSRAPSPKRHVDGPQRRGRRCRPDMAVHDSRGRCSGRDSPDCRSPFSPQMTPPPGSSGRSLERDRRQPDHDGDRRRHRHAARHAGGHLSGGIRPLFEARDCRSLHQRHPAERAVDRDRPLRLRDHGRADGAFLGHRRRRRSGGPRGSGRGSDHRRHVEPGSQRPARSRLRARHAAFPGDPADRLSRRQSGPGHRRAARRRAHQRRNRAAAVHRAEQSVLQHEPQSADIEPADRDLPICAEPLQGLATAGLDRGSDHHAGRPGAQHCGSRAVRPSATE